MTHKQRFIIIAWPEGVEEGKLAEIACRVQDELDSSGDNHGLVVAPIPSELHQQIESSGFLDELF